MVGNGLEAKIHQLNHEIIAHKKDAVIFSIKESISNIKNLFQDMQKDNISAIEDMNDQVRAAIMTLGMDEAQENNIQNITENCLERSNKAFYKGISIEENLENIYQKFHYVIGAKAET